MLFGQRSERRPRSHADQPSRDHSDADGENRDEAKKGNKGRQLPSERQCRSVRRMGFAFEVLTADEIEHILPELKAISNAWLDQHKTREKGFPTVRRGIVLLI